MARSDVRRFDKSIVYGWHPVCSLSHAMNGMSLPALGGAAVSAGLRGGIEHAVAVGYGLTYDAIVSSFAPYQALLEEVTGYAKRPPARRPRAVPELLPPGAGIPDLRDDPGVPGVGRRVRRASLARAHRPLRGLPRLRAALHAGRGVSRRPDAGGLRNPRGEADVPGRDQLPGLGASRGGRRGERALRGAVNVR